MRHVGTNIKAKAKIHAVWSAKHIALNLKIGTNMRLTNIRAIISTAPEKQLCLHIQDPVHSFGRHLVFQGAQKKHPRHARYFPEASKTAVALRLINNKDNVLPKRISMHPGNKPITYTYRYTFLGPL